MPRSSSPRTTTGARLMAPMPAGFRATAAPQTLASAPPGPGGPPLDPLSAQAGGFGSWRPDAPQLVTVDDDGGEADGVDGGGFQGDGDDDNLVLVDPTTGLATSAIQVGGTDLHPVDHPDWSPDGTRIAFVSVGDDTRSLQRFNTGKVGLVENPAAGWAAPT